MAAFGTQFTQIAAAHQHSDRAARLPTQFASSSFSHSAFRAPASSLAQPKQRGMVAATAVAATERPTGMQRPDASGRFGKYGGKYVPETLITALAELEAAYAETKNDPAFKVCNLMQLTATCWCIFWRIVTNTKYYDLQSEFAAILKDYVGRESPLYHADRLSEHYTK